MKTTMKMKLITSIIGLMSVLVVSGEDLPQLPPDLVQVKTAAYWKDGNKDGFVRICSFQRGFEHVHNVVVIEWITTPSDPNEKLSVLSKVIVEDMKMYSVGDAEFVRDGNKQFIRLSATHTDSHDQVLFSIELLGVGKIAVTKELISKAGADAVDHIDKTQAIAYLRKEGMINAQSKIVSAEWSDATNKWLIITEQGQHDDGQARYGHWFVDADGKNWSGSTCRH